MKKRKLAMEKISHDSQLGETNQILCG